MISLCISTADLGIWFFAYAKDRFFHDYAQLMLVLVYFQSLPRLRKVSQLQESEKKKVQNRQARRKGNDDSEFY